MSDLPPKRRRPPGYLRVLGLSVLVGMAVGGVAALIEAIGGSEARPLVAVVLAVGVSLGMALCLMWWRGADEAVREAHKWAWYWGGSAGIAFVMILFVLSSWDVIILTIPSFDGGPNGQLLSGVALTLGAQGVGYLVAWAAWWLRHR
jgi:xanthosine utilization system XapX-like protein